MKKSLSLAFYLQWFRLNAFAVFSFCPHIQLTCFLEYSSLAGFLVVENLRVNINIEMQKVYKSKKVYGNLTHMLLGALSYILHITKKQKKKKTTTNPSTKESEMFLHAVQIFMNLKCSHFICIHSSAHAVSTF